MFTGLVEELGKVRSIAKGADSARLYIGASRVLEGTALGDSIAVNGVCLTVVDMGGDYFAADVMAETLARSNLGSLRPGQYVNLERALRLGDRLGGHLVSGHIDAVGTITALERRDIALLVTVSAPPGVLRYVIRKGSVAIDGISLTVVDVGQHSFQVSLIPHTAKVTTLGYKQVGDTVNLEADLIGKYVERLLTGPGGEQNTKPAGLTMDFLVKHGFA
ncbi:MAG: riboflavin synthase [Bacillota bacterium]